MFTVTLEGETELATAWVNVTAAVRAGARRGVSMGVKEGADEARRKHAFRNRTGRLEKSIVGEVTGSSDTEHRGRIGAWATYASYVEYPTRPHKIRIRVANWLHWEAPPGDRHFAKETRHPGTAGQPFIGIAYAKCERVMIREIEIGIAQAQAILNR